MKHKRLICVQMSTDMEVYLDIVRVLAKSQEVEVLEVSLWQ